MSLKKSCLTFINVRYTPLAYANWIDAIRMIESGSALLDPFLEDWQSMVECTKLLTWHT